MSTEIRQRDFERLVERAKTLAPAKMFSFREIEQRTGASQRNLRYVLDHDLAGDAMFSGSDKLGQGRGVVQQFTVFTGFIVALAALMLESGLRGGLARNAMQFLFQWATAKSGRPYGRKIQAFLVFSWAQELVVEIGDGTRIRVLSAPGKVPPRIPCPAGTDWRLLDTGEACPGDYRPVIAVRLDLGALATKLR